MLTKKYNYVNINCQFVLYILMLFPTPTDRREEMELVALILMIVIYFFMENLTDYYIKIKNEWLEFLLQMTVIVVVVLPLYFFMNLLGLDLAEAVNFIDEKFGVLMFLAIFIISALVGSGLAQIVKHFFPRKNKEITSSK
ncbi:hypothetical protein A2533_00070 [Candidatus Falkowbacteria bacterium RIFOXYD2_FULL_35_9]|uniref:Uncharacterized protein n=1 Tax=Candidatus Falkowbacteria bacterium RIFOXYC2_FULL_36_12 TaxID=1798002 RepID=A0A1F5SYN6_9BACT|nr:MAG: hypothetical protein A2300_03265 [Candidatus Falkowbacteria bacterium RIFOXYB2_FULL_35_7]OGF31837.1 MAG: hypothetical protein A2478_05130 [Candidatus Falkowbacteria bacterium RIFOXYC2_FULL_36_12]OGF34640.1 MAG: hypothetical protein A2223_00640 [Candidatus Falkowbacteria bacterium RIFOXYA2_FULL_35_8]OGF45729.1 MAG: hypothetical protein A2533_00070 [Candidatus Falkowbacteria bacterium RIFOXYD2_FULL_35_9]